jgi:hypothetical protein
MTTLQREMLRDTLIDYLQLLISDTSLYNIVAQNNKIARVRLLLKEVA